MRDRLENWARWAWPRKTSPASCKSLESRYRPPDWQWGKPKTVPPEVDILDAVAVEKGLVSMPRREMNILTYSFLKSGYNFDAFCSRHKIRGDKILNKSEAFKMAEDTAIMMLTNVMERRGL